MDSSANMENVCSIIVQPSTSVYGLCMATIGSHNLVVPVELYVRTLSPNITLIISLCDIDSMLRMTGSYDHESNNLHFILPPLPILTKPIFQGDEYKI